jgi:hypothetical protein
MVLFFDDTDQEIKDDGYALGHRLTTDFRSDRSKSIWLYVGHIFINSTFLTFLIFSSPL